MRAGCPIRWSPRSGPDGIRLPGVGRIGWDEIGDVRVESMIGPAGYYRATTYRRPIVLLILRRATGRGCWRTDSRRR